MKLTGLHILLTYQCTFECDHCFVWGSRSQSGVLTIEQIHEVLRQAHEIDSMEWVYFEGGEPFLYYPVLLRGVQMKRDLTRAMYAQESWDLFVQGFTEAHCGGHLLWNLHDPGYRWHTGTPAPGVGDALKDVYVAIDREIGAILDVVREDATVILLANHGTVSYV